MADAPADPVHLLTLVAVPAAVGLLLWHFHRQCSRAYAGSWARSFAGVAFVRGTTTLAMLGVGSMSIRVGMSALGGAVAYLQVAALVLGCVEAQRQRSLRIVDARRMFAVVALTGAISGLIPFLVGGGESFSRLFYLALHLLTTGASFFVAGVLLRPLRDRRFALPSLAFFTYGAAQFYGLVLLVRHLNDASQPLQLGAIAMAEGLAGLIAVLGCAIAVFEDERQAARKAVSQAQHLAYHDSLTSLPNRTLFSDRVSVALSHAQRHRHKLAVIFLDIDHFKKVNDSLGHSIGDELLRITAARMRGAVRDEDTVARFGGDEFTVLVPIIGRAEHAGKVAQKLLAAVTRPMTIAGREFVVTASAGVAVFPGDGTDGETLIRNADAAMYRAKQAGRNTFQYYAPAMNREALESLELDSDLRRALAQNELVLHYQPLIDVETGSVFGIEALVRWQHPTRGLVPPDRFIPAAEQSGLIVPIGRWVLRQACLQAMDWHRRGRGVIVAVNLSARQFAEPDLMNDVRDALQESGLAPEFLELEITEGNAMQDVEKAIEILRQMKALGVRISIDDFGTGYSCLSYLKQFPVDTLKLDRSFVRDITTVEDAQIALGVIALAHSLKLKVIAEGVETLGQLAFLRENACDRLQGFLFSRPLPADKCEQYMTRHHALKIA